MRRLTGIFTLVCLTLAAPAWGHRFFTSLAEAEYDAERGAIEVSLRVDDHNLEDALSLRLGHPYRLTGDSGSERHARGYVADHFVIATPDGRRIDLEWVGWEWSPGITWLHFEFPVSGDPSELRLANSIFLELSHEQVNTVNVRSGTKRHTLTFDRKSRLQDPRFPPRTREASDSR